MEAADPFNVPVNPEALGIPVSSRRLASSSLIKGTSFFGGFVTYKTLACEKLHYLSIHSYL